VGFSSLLKKRLAFRGGRHPERSEGSLFVACRPQRIVPCGDLKGTQSRCLRTRLACRWLESAFPSCSSPLPEVRLAATVLFSGLSRHLRLLNLPLARNRGLSQTDGALATLSALPAGRMLIFSFLP
jgi:hypothetical protein